MIFGVAIVDLSLAKPCGIAFGRCRLVSKQKWFEKEMIYLSCKAI